MWLKQQRLAHRQGTTHRGTQAASSMSPGSLHGVLDLAAVVLQQLPLLHCRQVSHGGKVEVVPVYVDLGMRREAVHRSRKGGGHHSP